MARWFRTVDPAHAARAESFDAAAAGARYRLAAEVALAIWERVRAEGAESAERRFHEVAAKVAAAGVTLEPAPGKRTRVGVELAGERTRIPRWDAPPALPGHATLFRHEERDGEVDPTTPAVAEALAQVGQGAPLSDALRAPLEARFGADFGNVRVHEGAVAASAADSLRARAFTVGEDIFFARSAFAPSSSDGRRLLLHELAHVVQAQQGRVPTTDGLAVSRPGDALEREAVAAAAHEPEAPAPTVRSSALRGVPNMLLRAESGSRDDAESSAATPRTRGFVVGFARALGQGVAREMVAKILRDFAEPRNAASIASGELTGIGQGLWESLSNNAIGIWDIAKWMFWNVSLNSEVAEAELADPDPVRRQEREQAILATRETLRAGFSALRTFLVSEPAVLAQIGEDWGEVAGAHVAARFPGFVAAPPWEKGRILGFGIGYLLMEVAMLLVTPQMIAAKFPAIAKLLSRGGKAVEVIRGAMKREPELQKALAQTSRVAKVAKVAKAGSRVALSNAAYRRISQTVKNGLNYHIKSLGKGLTHVDHVVPEELLIVRARAAKLSRDEFRNLLRGTPELWAMNDGGINVARQSTPYATWLEPRPDAAQGVHELRSMLTDAQKTRLIEMQSAADNALNTNIARAGSLPDHTYRDLAKTAKERGVALKREEWQYTAEERKIRDRNAEKAGNAANRKLPSRPAVDGNTR